MLDGVVGLAWHLEGGVQFGLFCGLGVVVGRQVLFDFLVDLLEDVLDALELAAVLLVLGDDSYLYHPKSVLSISLSFDR